MIKTLKRLHVVLQNNEAKSENCCHVFEANIRKAVVFAIYMARTSEMNSLITLKKGTSMDISRSITHSTHFLVL